MMKINYPKNKSLDLSTLIGLLLTFSLLYAAINIGSSPTRYFDLPSFLIVFCGTMTVTFSCSNFEQFLKLPGVISQAIFFKDINPRDTAILALQIAKMVKEEPIMKIEDKINLDKCDYLLRKALNLISDNMEIDKIVNIIDQEINTYMDDLSRSVSIIRKAGELAPPMGLIGTLIGMIQMLQELHDPSKLGPAMSVSLLTTFYGTILSYIVFFPLAAKIEKNFGDKLINAKIYKQTAMSIIKKENPRMLEININSLLSPENNINYFKK